MPSPDPTAKPELSSSPWSTGLWWIVLAGGAAGWLVCALGVDPAGAWRGLLVNFLFFISLAAGLVVWPAIIVRANGKWTTANLERPALTALGFAPVSLLMFLILWVGYRYWAGWLRYEHLPQGDWLRPLWVVLRDLIGLIVLWLLAAWFVCRRTVERSTLLAGWLIFVYCLVFSLLGFDLVMALDPRWYSALFGGYYLISGVSIGIAAWTFSATRLPVRREQLTDLAKLIVAFSLLTTYMMYSQLLPIWYENLPQETRFLIPRMNAAPWRWISLGLLAVIYLGPLVVLLTGWSKRTPAFLGGVALAVLVGMWIERWWLVTPTLGGSRAPGLPEATGAAAFLAAFVLSRRRLDRGYPLPADEKEELP